MINPSLVEAACNIPYNYLSVDAVLKSEAHHVGCPYISFLMPYIYRILTEHLRNSVDYSSNTFKINRELKYELASVLRRID